MPKEVIDNAYGGDANFWANLVSDDIGGGLSGLTGGWLGVLIGAGGNSAGTALGELFK
jgi:hypothetical protein